MVSGLVLVAKVFHDTRRFSNRVTINRQVTARARTVRGYSTSFGVENDFVLISHILPELRKELKNKKRLKTTSADKEAI